jgi:hypothetical protein
MDEWTVQRLSGDALTRLAASWLVPGHEESVEVWETVHRKRR